METTKSRRSEEQTYSPPRGLPPGFRFHPTDEELITCYLARKLVHRSSFRDHGIPEVDLTKHEPWDLPETAQMVGEKEWYFYSRIDRKYPYGSRINRATKAGYWKATGKDKEVFMRSPTYHGFKKLVGMKKILVFYKGRAPKALKSNWVMHEYRIDENANITSLLQNDDLAKLQRSKEDWVLCRVFHKKPRQGYHPAETQMRCDDAFHDAELLATTTRFLLADDDQQLPQPPPNVAAPPPFNMAGADDLAAAASTNCSSSVFARSELPLQSIYALRHECYSSFVASGGTSYDPRLLPASTSASLLPPVPSDLESLWLHASAFLP